MNITDRYCLDLFPELEEIYGIADLEEASSYGSYVFHENLFLRFIINQKDEKTLERVALYVRYLFTDENPHLNNLAQIGILEGLIEHDFSMISSFLYKAVGKDIYRNAINNAQKRMRFNVEYWL